MLYRLLDTAIHHRSLWIIDHNGKLHKYGRDDDGEVVVRLHDRQIEQQILYSPYLAIGEGYMDGRLTIEKGTLYGFLDILGENRVHLNDLVWFRAVSGISRLWHRIGGFNPIGRSVRNVAHHYDLSDQLYELFLDKDRQYSCGYFLEETDDLETAQETKKAHLAAKLRLGSNCHVLDIGCGWGGLARYIARTTGCRVTGITLSQNQYDYAVERTEAEGLSDLVDFHLRDYRHVRGTFDRIVSVGMFEHVGTKHHRCFFQTVKELLRADGVAVVHSIGRMEPPSYTSGWMRKYIFPGGYIPALSETVSTIERTGLWVSDIEILRRHYALTIREWRNRFTRNRLQIARLYDERFCRMWEFYLACAETAFVHWRQMVFQVQLSSELGALPLTRDYMWQTEQALRRR